MILQHPYLECPFLVRKINITVFLGLRTHVKQACGSVSSGGNDGNCRVMNMEKCLIPLKYSVSNGMLPPSERLGGFTVGGPANTRTSGMMIMIKISNVHLHRHNCFHQHHQR
jgi:hypothetical protein